MNVQAHVNHEGASARASVRRIGCVSFINAKPLIEGLDAGPNPAVRLDVPSRLLEDLESGEVDVALCPVIDYHRSRTPLVIVPVGGIGCQGPTLTVRLFSQAPFHDLNTVFADTDSHTSVALLRIILSRMYSVRPAVIDYNAREQTSRGRPVNDPQAMLLIGDKVVTEPMAADASRFPYQLDLGQAWAELTGLPFVFAVWMARVDTPLGDLPALLESTRLRNAGRIDAIVRRYADFHGWPHDLATLYLGKLMRYRIEEPQIQAMERFARFAAADGVIPAARPLRMYAPDQPPTDPV